MGEDFCHALNSLISSIEYVDDVTANLKKENIVASKAQTSIDSFSTPVTPKIRKYTSKSTKTSKSVKKSNRSVMRPSTRGAKIEQKIMEELEREGDCPSNDSSSSDNDDI